MHGKLFEYFITHARIDRYHLMCYIIAHNKQQLTYVDGLSSGGGIPIPNNSRIEALKALGGTLNFIDFWLELFHQNYEVRGKMYNEDMEVCSNKYQQ